MELRFIERDGKRILQQRVEHYITPYNDLDKRFAWQDVPFVDDRIQVGPGAAGLEKLRAASVLVAERDALEAERNALRERLNDAEARCARLEADHDTPQALLRTLAAEHANNLRASRDAGKRELRRVETERNELEAELGHQRGITRHRMRECERLEEKLKGKEKDAADWHKRYAALDKALLQRVGFRTRALVLETADDIFPELS